MCVSTVNNIGIEGAKGLSQCLTHFTHLRRLGLSSECIDIELGVCDAAFMMCCVICVCEYSEQHWNRGSKGIESVLDTLDSTHTP